MGTKDQGGRKNPPRPLPPPAKSPRIDAERQERNLAELRKLMNMNTGAVT